MYGVIRCLVVRGRRPWVAQVTGLDATYGLRREFLWHADDTVQKDLYFYFPVAPGLYEVSDNVRPRRHPRRRDLPIEWRYFVRVRDDGQVVEISKEEVIRCLKSVPSE